MLVNSRAWIDLWLILFFGRLSVPPVGEENGWWSEQLLQHDLHWVSFTVVKPSNSLFKCPIFDTKCQALTLHGTTAAHTENSTQLTDFIIFITAVISLQFTSQFSVGFFPHLLPLLLNKIWLNTNIQLVKVDWGFQNHRPYFESLQIWGRSANFKTENVSKI